MSVFVGWTNADDLTLVSPHVEKSWIVEKARHIIRWVDVDDFANIPNACKEVIVLFVSLYNRHDF